MAELQSRLGRLGFFPDRVDGIFGPQTAAALTEFQRNTGLTADGICGPATVDAVARLGRGAPGRVKAEVLERELLRRAPRDLQGRRVVVGDFGGLELLTSATVEALHVRGAQVVCSAHPDGSEEGNVVGKFLDEWPKTRK